mmetsp:Transcript_37676/g.112450  ORF Transcript_37676/g.112450 Transcript_37676/m.112450 type:complete len:275 (-) Transcript_37676:2102-2926(-)
MAWMRRSERCSVRCQSRLLPLEERSCSPIKRLMWSCRAPPPSQPRSATTTSSSRTRRLPSAPLLSRRRVSSTVCRERTTCRIARHTTWVALSLLTRRCTTGSSSCAERIRSACGPMKWRRAHASSRRCATRYRRLTGARAHSGTHACLLAGRSTQSSLAIKRSSEPRGQQSRCSGPEFSSLQTPFVRRLTGPPSRASSSGRTLLATARSCTRCCGKRWRICAATRPRRPSGRLDPRCGAVLCCAVPCHIVPCRAVLRCAAVLCRIGAPTLSVRR